MSLLRRPFPERDDVRCHVAGSCLSLMEETLIKSCLQKLLFPRYQYENNPFPKINSPHTSKVEYIKCCKKEKNSSCRDGFRNFRVCRGNPELLAYFFTFLTASKCSVADKSAGNKILWCAVTILVIYLYTTGRLSKDAHFQRFWMWLESSLTSVIINTDKCTLPTRTRWCLSSY